MRLVRVVPMLVVVGLLMLAVPGVRHFLGDALSGVLDSVDHLLDRLADVDPVVLYSVAALATALEASLLIGLFLPGDVVVLFVGTTASSPAEFMLAVAVVAIGSVVGEMIGYGIGRRYQRRLRSAWIGRKVGQHRWRAADAFFLNRGGGPAVFGARFVAAAHALVPIVAGSTRMPARVFLSWTSAGAIVWALLYVTVGAVAAKSAGPGIGSSAAVGQLALAVVLLVGGSVWIFSRRANRRRL